MTFYSLNLGSDSLKLRLCPQFHSCTYMDVGLGIKFGTVTVYIGMRKYWFMFEPG